MPASPTHDLARLLTPRPTATMPAPPPSPEPVPPPRPHGDAAVLEALEEGLVLVDVTGAVTRCNAAAARILGVSTGDLEAAGPASLRWQSTYPDGGVWPTSEQPSQVALRSGQPCRAEALGVRRADGARRWLSVSAVPLVDAEGAVTGVVTTFTDITDARQAAEALVDSEARFRRLALTDSLTGLANRAHLTARTGDALAHLAAGPTTRTGQPACVALLRLDVDRFTLINDSLGMTTGDDLLAAVGRRLRALTRDADTVARLGADEFCVLAEDVAGMVEAMALAERLRSALAFPHDLGVADPVTATVSIGVSLAEGPGRSTEELLREADLALHAAKESGRDRIAVFGGALRAEADERAQAERRLRRALGDGWLALEYQPVIDVATGRIVGAEALVRLDDPDAGRLAPASFIEVAEQTGLIVAVDEWVLGEAVRQAARWREELAPWGMDMMAVNVSARTLAHPRFAGHLAQALGDSHLPGAGLHVELTERTLVDTSSYALAALAQLGELGVSVGIDDFGTGYSALAYLQRFSLDFVKVDRGFTSRLCEDPRSVAIVRAVVELAHALGLVVVAEGVETPEQLAAVAALGCDRVQGFLVARPLRPEALSTLVRSGATFLS